MNNRLMFNDRCLISLSFDGLFIYILYLYSAFVKRIIHKLMCSNALFVQ